ncbi:hypothetical protein AAZX31_10G138900 [Glycine max]
MFKMIVLWAMFSLLGNCWTIASGTSPIASCTFYIVSSTFHMTSEIVIWEVK